MDVSYGGVPNEGAVSLGPNGDLKYDCARAFVATRRPLPDGCVHTAIITHVLEYIEPAQVFAWFDGLHRAMRTLGIAHFSGPYGGDESQGWLSDPTHRTRIVEQSFGWLDPQTPFYGMHGTVGRETPRPWRTLAVARVPGAHGTWSYNVSLQALPMPKKGKR